MTGQIKPKEILSLVENSPLIREVRQGKGSHVIAFPQDKSISPMVIPVHCKDMGRGLSLKIIKWMMEVGIICIVFLLVRSLIFYNYGIDIWYWGKEFIRLNLLG